MLTAVDSAVVRQNFFSLGKTPQFLLLRPSTGWMKSMHIMEGKSTDCRC